MRDPVRSVYQCEAIHGGYSRCTGAEGHDGPHSNASYVWTDKTTVVRENPYLTAEQKANFQEAIKGGRASKVVESKDSGK